MNLEQYRAISESNNPHAMNKVVSFFLLSQIKRNENKLFLHNGFEWCMSLWLKNRKDFTVIEKPIEYSSVVVRNVESTW